MMKSTIKVMVRKGQINNKQVWLLYFLFNEELNLKIKIYLNGKWCPKLNCWWVEYGETSIAELKSLHNISIFKSNHIYMCCDVIFNSKKLF